MEAGFCTTRLATRGIQLRSTIDRRAPYILAPVTGRLSTSVLEIGHERIRGEFGPCILSDFAEPQADARTIVELNYPHIIGI
jgi:hypothetical protein